MTKYMETEKILNDYFGLMFTNKIQPTYQSKREDESEDDQT